MKYEPTKSRANDALPPSGARTGHMVAFVIACLMLILCTVCLLGQIRMAGAEIEPVPEEEGGGYYVAGMLVVGAVIAMANFITMAGFAVTWILGQCISAALTMERHNKPRWLWVASTVMACAFLLLFLLALFVQLGLK